MSAVPLENMLGQSLMSRIVAKSFQNPSERLRTARRGDLANNDDTIFD